MGGSGGSLGPTIPARGSSTASRRSPLSCRTHSEALKNARRCSTRPRLADGSRWAWSGSTPSRKIGRSNGTRRGEVGAAIAREKLNVPVLRGLPSPDQYTPVGYESTRVHSDQCPLWMGTRTAVDGQCVRSYRPCDLGGITERRLCRSLAWPCESVQDISSCLCRLDWWPTSAHSRLLPPPSAHLRPHPLSPSTEHAPRSTRKKRQGSPQRLPPASLSAPSDNHPAA